MHEPAGAHNDHGSPSTQHPRLSPEEPDNEAKEFCAFGLPSRSPFRPALGILRRIQHPGDLVDAEIAFDLLLCCSQPEQGLQAGLAISDTHVFFQ